MKITFLGAARTVTGSQHLVTVNGHKLLLDCGLYQGDQDSYERNKEFSFDPAEIEAVILSHAHIDHSGNLPNLVKRGFKGRIYTSFATAHLADIMLRNSAHIQENSAADANEPEPLYTMQDAVKVAPLFYPVYYDTEFKPIPGVSARLHDAGHILGSAGVQMDVREDGRVRRLWYSGDIGRRNLPLIRDPILPKDVDFLIMESTYGDKEHEDPLVAADMLRQVLAATIRRGGKVVIPAFAVGRTQEIVYDIHHMIERGEIPRVPVFVDSPLATEASKVFSEHPEFFDDEVRDFLRKAESRAALGFDLLRYIESARESKVLDKADEPFIVISTSGMADFGRVVHHIESVIEDPRSTILMVSYQAPNTLGRALANGEKKVVIGGREYQRKADVAFISGLSAHAGQHMLVEYARAVKDRVKQVFLVHGEQAPVDALRRRLRDLGIQNVHYPEPKEEVELEVAEEVRQ